MLDKDLLDRFAPVRADFPGAENGPYLDVAARGLLYAGGRAAVEAHLERGLLGEIDKQALFRTVEDVRSSVASLIRCDPDEIAFTGNVTDGIAKLAASLPWKPGENVVLCEELEHPANIYPWYGLARKFGIEVKQAAASGGRLLPESILDSIDERTRVVAVSAVSFAPGFRFPIRELGIECRRRGVLLIVDAAQSIGVLDMDVNSWHADAVVASTQKGLLALYGLGILYVRRGVAEQIQPTCLSRFGVALDQAHEASAGDPRSYAFAAGARRFEVGNYNYPAVIALGASVDFLLGLSMQAVERYVIGLARHFIDRIGALGLPVYGGTGDHHSHMVTVGYSLGDVHDATADQETASLYEFLRNAGVRISIRRNLLRFSFHVYNGPKDLEHVMGLIQAWKSGATVSMATPCAASVRGVASE